MNIDYEIESFTPAPAGWVLVYQHPDGGRVEHVMAGWLTITTSDSEDSRVVVAADVIEGHLVPAPPVYGEFWGLVEIAFRPSQVRALP